LVYYKMAKMFNQIAVCRYTRDSKMFQYAISIYLIVFLENIYKL